ncbi:hypothetical protein HanIR_Chr01g0002761 [Helianthus annuus]|nr:hypothetical protein HanIR_Chr01g0002761 [Helianthus annuus]
MISVGCGSWLQSHTSRSVTSSTHSFNSSKSFSNHTPLVLCIFPLPISSPLAFVKITCCPTLGSKVGFDPVWFSVTPSSPSESIAASWARLALRLFNLLVYTWVDLGKMRKTKNKIAKKKTGQMGVGVGQSALLRNSSILLY